MKPAKALLYIVFLLLLVFGISGTTAYSLHVIFNIPTWAPFILITVLQFVGWAAWDKYIEFDAIKTRLDELNAKPFREYLFPLPCQHCSTMQQVVINLENDEFICEHCGKENVVRTEFKTAAKVAEINEKGILGRMAAISDQF